MLPSYQTYGWGTAGNQGTTVEVHEAFNPKGIRNWTTTNTKGIQPSHNRG